MKSYMIKDNFHGIENLLFNFMKACSNLEVQQAFTSYNNPKGNADTERIIRTLKEELFWLREWKGEAEISEELEAMIKRIPAGFLGSTKDAVEAASFLLSEEAKYVNGTNIHLSGGWGM